jgi:hypothetical protein
MKDRIVKNDMINQYKDYSIPTIMAAGCTNGSKSDFTEVSLILGSEGRDAFSGVVVSQWFSASHESDDGGKAHVSIIIPPNTDLKSAKPRPS